MIERRRPPKPATLLVALALAVGLGGAACSDDSGDPALIGQVQQFQVDSRDHTQEAVDYAQTPPVGGPHNEIWQSCGFYAEPILNETAVHSMEHGAVWITFRADLPSDQVEQIQSLAQQEFVLASPWGGDDLPAPIVFSAWGVQLWLESLPDPAADEFMATFRRGAQTPEPEAPCTGGHSETL
jgi:hypothetical protein